MRLKYINLQFKERINFLARSFPPTASIYLCDFYTVISLHSGVKPVRINQSCTLSYTQRVVCCKLSLILPDHMRDYMSRVQLGVDTVNASRDEPTTRTSPPWFTTECTFSDYANLLKYCFSSVERRTGYAGKAICGCRRHADVT